MLKKYFKAAGIEWASVHTLRHTFGIHQLRMGASPKVIEEVMGYRDPRSVSIYTDLIKGGSSRAVQKHLL